MLLANIKKLCNDKDTTICQLEKDLDIGRGSISKWSKCQPTLGNILKISKYFQVPIDYLLGDETLSKEALEYAKRFDKLNDKQKDLLKCFTALI